MIASASASGRALRPALHSAAYWYLNCGRRSPKSVNPPVACTTGAFHSPACSSPLPPESQSHHFKPDSIGTHPCLRGSRHNRQRTVRHNGEWCGGLSAMAREGIEPPTRGFSGRQRPISPGLSKSIRDRPASTYDGSPEHRAPRRTLEYRGIQVLIRYGVSGRTSSAEPLPPATLSAQQQPLLDATLSSAIPGAIHSTKFNFFISAMNRGSERRGSNMASRPSHAIIWEFATSAASRLSSARAWSPRPRYTSARLKGST